MTSVESIGDTLKGGLGEFPNTARGMCELTKAAEDHFRRSADDGKRMIGTIESWLLDYGSEYEFRSRPDWLPRGTPNMCFVNSFALAISAEGKERDLRYCEGYMHGPDCPLNIHHAWCIDAAGVVIDPTLPEDHWDLATISYFGVAVPTEPLIELFETGEVGCVLDNQPGRELVEKHHQEARPNAR